MGEQVGSLTWLTLPLRRRAVSPCSKVLMASTHGTCYYLLEAPLKIKIKHSPLVVPRVFIPRRYHVMVFAAVIIERWCDIKRVRLRPWPFLVVLLLIQFYSRPHSDWSRINPGAAHKIGLTQNPSIVAQKIGMIRNIFAPGRILIQG